MSNLVIVESPAKAKTIKKYLGKDFEVVASMGHVRDLPKSKFGVDVDHDFTPMYVDIKGKEDLIKDLKKAAKKSDAIFLATDPDREGEAISWHLAQMLGVDMNQPNRVTFNEITKSGVKYGMDHPRMIDVKLVDAQQARRVLDRIVGYKISPFLWRKVRKGLSAGRVQSVAVRIIMDREEEIRAFKQQEYWSIDAKLAAKGHAKKPFPAKLYAIDGKKLELTAIPDEKRAREIVESLDGADYIVSNVKKGVRRKSPAPPFITSTLQQEASRRLGYQSRRTMKVAQELYEGVEIEGIGATGLITYMRTDSLRISDEAAEQAKIYITDTYGKEYLPATRRVFKTKKNAQDAHEAIRPSDPSLTPDRVKKDLTAEQYKLYKLIWERFIASQMANALLDTVAVDIEAANCLFKASGFTVKFDGFTVLYEESKDTDDENTASLPPLEAGNVLTLKELTPNQHFTQPPARYTEASLIKTLEENGIGRPSTYAPTITTILARGYVERENKSLKPTALGEVTTKLMEEQFAKIVDVTFTANMEKTLDEVEEGNVDYPKMLSGFYDDFMTTLEQAEKNMDGTRVKVPDEETDIVCELCGRKMVIKTGRFGKFLACPGFPECRNTKKIVKETGGLCPVCGGKVLAKKSKNGKGYYGCEHNPQCQFMTWDKPLSETCPKCGSTLFQKTGRGALIHCLKEGCDYARPVKPKKEADE
ncbi:type I DNA topoisomerase [Anaerotruncus colihominis]|nr:type I DNA topoisomerase [Anaerotruncus colihominis]MBS4989096.1 type I DNA topoisomerase [Anaerotruncus colihominis]MCQ4734168.1 type I DNA topoisomerase [Anaerotruncus colihominis]UOX65745.1 type I DNA topoisomerase [Anaerotruncus colihominis]UWN76258.1 type I DNA topoisomerase [Anaerotruncus colihominis]